MRSSTLETTICSTSGLVRHNWVHSPFAPTRRPPTSLYQSGCSLKYLDGGRIVLNVWEMSSPPPNLSGGPPNFAPSSPDERLSTPFNRRCEANSGFFLCASRHDVMRSSNAGRCSSSSESGTAKRLRLGTTVRHDENQPTPPCVSSISYTPYSTPRFPPQTKRSDPFALSRKPSSPYASSRTMRTAFPDASGATGNSTPVIRFT